MSIHGYEVVVKATIHPIVRNTLDITLEGPMRAQQRKLHTRDADVMERFFQVLPQTRTVWDAAWDDHEIRNDSSDPEVYEPHTYSGSATRTFEITDQEYDTAAQFIASVPV